MEKKTHFKMYKAKTKWMVAGITTGVALLSALGAVSADNVPNASSASSTNNVATPQSGSVQNSNPSSSSQSNSNVVVLKSEPVQKQNVQQNSQGTPVKKADNQQFIEYSNGQAKPIASSQTQSSVQTSTPKAAQPVKVVAQSSSNVQQNQKAQTNNYAQQLSQYQNSQKQTRDDGANAPITDTLPQAQDNAHDDVYHMQTTQGWSNDVQTIVIGNGGQTHYYFLHSVDGATNPFGPSGQDWESVDTYETWSNNGQGNPNPNEYKNPHIALNSHGTSNPNSWKSAWTGSVIQNRGDIQGVPKGDEVAYFAGLNKSDDSQNIYAAWSDDGGETFTHALNNGAPVLAWNQAGASGKQDQERDSYVTYDENGKLLMYTAEGNQLGVYTSTNGINWVPSGKVGPDQFFKGLNWDDKQNMPIECPQLANLKDESDNNHVVLFYGCKDPQNGQTTGTYYVVGHLDSNDDFIADFPAHRLDQGSDYYGANIQQNTLDNPIDGVDGIGWIGNWNYTSAGVYDNQDSQGKMTPHLGSYSLPRVYSLNSDGTLSTAFQHVYTTPTYATGNDDISIDNPIIGIKTEDHSIKVDTDNGQPVYKMYQSNIDGSASHYKFDFSDVNNYDGRVYIKISQGKDYVILNYDPRNGMYRVSRYSSELNNDMQKTVASSYYYDGALGNGLGYSADDGALNNDSTSENTLQDFTIEIYTDQDSIEFVMPNGHVYTCARYGTDKLQRIEVDTSDKNSQLDYDYTTYNGPKYELKDGEETNMGEPGNNTSVVNPKADNSATDNPVMPPTNSGSDNSSNSNSGSSTTPSTDKPSSGSSSSSSSTTNNSKPDSSTSSSDSNKPSDTTGTQPSDSTTSKYQIVINYVDPYHDDKVVGQKVISGTGQVPSKSDIENDMMSNLPKGYAGISSGDDIQTELSNVKPVDKNGVATYTYTISVEQPKQSDGQPATKPNDNTGSSSSSTSASKPSTDNKPANSGSSTPSSTTNNSKPDSSTSSSNSNKPSGTTNAQPSGSTLTKPNDKPSQGTTDNKPSSSTAGQTGSSSSSSSTTPGHSSQPANNPNDVNHDVNGNNTTTNSKNNVPTANPSAENTDEDKPVQKPDGTVAKNPDDITSGSTEPGRPATEDNHSDVNNSGSGSTESTSTVESTNTNNQSDSADSNSVNSTNSANTPVNNAEPIATTTGDDSSSTSDKQVQESNNSNDSNDSVNETSKVASQPQQLVEKQAVPEADLNSTSTGNAQSQTQSVVETAYKPANRPMTQTEQMVVDADNENNTQTANNSEQEQNANTKAMPQTGESGSQAMAEVGLSMLGVVETASLAINKKRFS